MAFFQFVNCQSVAYLQEEGWSEKVVGGINKKGYSGRRDEGHVVGEGVFCDLAE